MLEEVAAVARGEWESGSTLLHHQMKKFISEEYEDNVGKHPFLNLSDKSILGKCKEVAESMGRPDLIFGYKKT